jgi:hypothetical protein
MVNSCITLTTTKKNQLSVSDYYAKMSHFDNELAASDNPLHDDELFAYLLASLDKDFNLVFTAMVARVDPITLSGLYAQFLSFEHHTNLHAHNSWGGGGGGHRRPWLRLVVAIPLVVGGMAVQPVALPVAVGAITAPVATSPTSSPSRLAPTTAPHHIPSASCA